MSIIKILTHEGLKCAATTMLALSSLTLTIVANSTSTQSCGVDHLSNAYQR